MAAAKLRVAAYARVSSDSDDQINSYIAQVDYYARYIASKEDWELVDVYADEGLTGMETRLAAGRAVWRPDRFFRHECRAFVKMADGTVCGRKIHQAFPTFHDRRRYTGLVDAEVTFFPPAGVTPEFLVLDTRDRWNMLHGDLLEPEWHDTPSGRYAVVKHVTGALQISW